ncbi:hypothetical protein KBX06_18140 [Micromonospora sp. C31]|uniref:hypothetical protein n=1 Tax=Micromonospora sp. C31 TaxID=2824876 RepID=UPI001B37EE49|nr:hypothetical protein [Micromonospora sp. C31]MBQ1075070.1 hypothetical protein [Micromonospora sp. C31]
MRERSEGGPLPPARPVPGGRPPQPDGDRVPDPSRAEPSGVTRDGERLPSTRRQYAYGGAVALLVLVLLVVGILR